MRALRAGLGPGQRRRFSSLVRSALAARLRDMRVFLPNAVQVDAITAAKSGDDVLCVAQTGSGKTLCFLLPLIETLLDDPRAHGLVVAPSRELAIQHADIAERLISDLPGAPAVRLLPDAPSRADAATRLVIAQPDDALTLLQNAPAASFPTTVAIDEVDEVLCGGQYEATLSPRGAALLDALGGVTRGGVDPKGPEGATAPRGRTLRASTETSPPQYLLTTAHLARAHQKVLSERFGDAVRVQQRKGGGGDNAALVPTLRQVGAPCLSYACK